MEILFINEYVVCELDREIPVLKHRWLKKPPSEEFRNGLLSMQKIYLEYKSEFENLKWLADTELLGELEEEDEYWLTTEWDQKLFQEAGVKVHAVILGDSLFSDYPMEVFKKSSAQKFDEMGVKLDVFANAVNAYEWLKKN